VWSRCIRGTALAALGRDGGDDFDAALVDARATGEPTLILQAMRTSVAARPDAALVAEAQGLVRAISASHPDPTTRARFLDRAAIT
jgi:hypothetical protein